MISISLLLAVALQQQPAIPAATRPLPVTVAGVVVRVGAKDSVPVPRVTVVLHRVGQKAQGPVDSIASDAKGHFQLQFRPDSGALYLVSARYRGIEYFAPPVSRDARKPDLQVQLIVYDTSSTVPLTVSARHVVVGNATATGERNIADLVLLENASALTRLAGDSLHPVWQMRLPRGAVGIELGESDFAVDAVRQRGDSVVLNASIPPGKREFTLTYRVPAGVNRFAVPVDHDVVAADLLSEDASLKVGGGLARGDTLTVVERHFTRWDGSLVAGRDLTLEFSAPASIPNWGLPVLIAFLGVGLIVMSVIATRRTRALSALVAAPAVSNSRATGISAEAAALIDRIAMLDAQHAGGQGAVASEEWQRYLDARAALKRELAALLPR